MWLGSPKIDQEGDAVPGIQRFFRGKVLTVLSHLLEFLAALHPILPLKPAPRLETNDSPSFRATNPQLYQR